MNIIAILNGISTALTVISTIKKYYDRVKPHLEKALEDGELSNSEVMKLVFAGMEGGAKEAAVKNQGK